ncbi:MAG: dihydrolipoyl dehydrogenase [Deltaproteobacteria bacterium]|nr:dihydrolipoyl dehydrogenase [Deltaproteobacteria bacterium]
MKNYDVIVIGSGCGSIIADEAVAHGFKMALVDRGPLGGTCLNVGCIPSKMLIYPADRIVEIEEATKKLGIEAGISNIDFKSIMARMRHNIRENQNHIREGIKQVKKLDFYEGEGHFTGDYTLEVNGEKIKGKKIFIASGSRPFIPPIKGLDSVDYLTNETVLELKARPDSLIIIGGGYIAVEYGHFFAAMGTKVTMLEMADRLVLPEEPEISGLLRKALSKRMAVHTGVQAAEVKRKGNGVTVLVKDKKTGKEKSFSGQSVLMAVGRRSNADILKVENSGVETDERGFIKVDRNLETSQKNNFAVGDANGQQMFTHVANREAVIVVHNAFHDAKFEMDYSAAPHAIYSHPQIASVGLTEENARKDHKILVGRAKYNDAAKGEAMMETEGLAKAIVEKETEKILGFHIIGPSAPILIQEVVNAMASGGHTGEIDQSLHIHPALTELITTVLNNLEEP